MIWFVNQFFVDNLFFEKLQPKKYQRFRVFVNSKNELTIHE